MAKHKKTAGQQDHEAAMSLRKGLSKLQRKHGLPAIMWELQGLAEGQASDARIERRKAHYKAWCGIAVGLEHVAVDLGHMAMDLGE